MNAIAISVLIWIAANSPLEWSPADGLPTMVRGTMIEGTKGEAHVVGGRPMRYEIRIASDVDLGTRAGQSVLVHELTHWLQLRAGLVDEAQARDLQRLFVLGW